MAPQVSYERINADGMCIWCIRDQRDSAVHTQWVSILRNRKKDRSQDPDYIPLFCENYVIPVPFGRI